MSNDNNIDACACMNMRKAARLVAKFYDQRLQPSGLRNTQFTLLVTLHYMAPISIGKLADEMGADRTTLARNLRLLEKEGFITDQPGEDSRVRLLSLTKEGKQAIEETKPYWEDAQSDFLKKFGKRRWQELQRELSFFTTVVDEK